MAEMEQNVLVNENETLSADVCSTTNEQVKTK